MSFSSHPFRDFDVGLDVNGYYHWQCNSCGATSNIFVSEASIKDIHLEFIAHVKKSHRLTIEDVEGWYSRMGDSDYE